MPTVGTTSRPGYVYDQGTDTWIPIGVGPHSHDTSSLVPYSSFYSGGKNFLINGLFDIWQRSTDVTASTSMGTFYAAADRWQNWVGTSCNSRYQRIADADPGISQYSYRIQRVAGVTTATNYQFTQNIETPIAKLLVGKQLTLSFRVKKGANWSDPDGVMRAKVIYNNNVDGNAISQATTEAFGANFSPTTSFATYTVTGTIPSSGVSSIMVNFYWEVTGTAGADDWLEFSAVQLEVGPTNSPFNRSGGNIAGELAACQRYYWRQVSGTTYGVVCTSGIMESTTGGSFVIQLPVPMRVAPTSIDTSNLRITDLHTTNSPASSFTLSDRNELFVLVRANASGLTANRPAWLTAYNSGASYLGLSAEL